MGDRVAERNDLQHMRRALELAVRGRGRTSPNPMVGAVLVGRGGVVGEGFHHGAGREHAEIEALKEAGGEARGSTLYVSLEPCCHQGRTGPCTWAIVEAGVRRVVYAVDDPNPLVSGRGAAILRDNGIEVSDGVLAAEAERLNEAFFFFHRNRRPFVVLKSAQTLDGRIAARNGRSKWISGPPALELAHTLRAECDAVVVGTGTVRVDDPSLTVRHVPGENPYRIVVGRNLDSMSECRLIRDNADGKTIIATTLETARSISFEEPGRKPVVWGLPTESGGRVSLEHLLAKAVDLGVLSVLVEGGATLATSFLKASLVDKYIQITAPKILGRGISGIGDLGISELTRCVVFDRARFENLGDDNVFTGYVRREA